MYNGIAPALLVEAVTEAARDGRELRRWRSIARQELRAAKRLPDGSADPYRVAHRIRRGWERLERALDAALMESDISRRGEVA